MGRELCLPLTNPLTSCTIWEPSCYLYPLRALGCLCFSISLSRNGSLHGFSSVFRDSGAGVTDCLEWANFSSSSAVVQTVLELLDVVLQKGSPKQFSGILWFFKWGLLALMFVYTWRWILAVVKSEQKQQMQGTSKTRLLNCLHLGCVSMIHGKIGGLFVYCSDGLGKIIIIIFPWIFVDLCLADELDLVDAFPSFVYLWGARAPPELASRDY